MKKILSKKIMAYILIMTIIGVGIYIANVTFPLREIIVKGILGFNVLFLLCRLYVLPTGSANESVDMLFESPKNIKYFVWGVYWSIVIYLAISQTFDTVYYLIKTVFPR